jgi:hypothetical protein
VFTFLQNDCSRSCRKGVHVDPEYAISRNQLRVTMDYYTDGDAVFKLYDKNSFFKLREVKGVTRESHPIKLKNPPPGFPPGRPVYEVITVDGITDIIEHRKQDPIFYVTDDPNIWKELGVESRSK